MQQRERGSGPHNATQISDMIGQWTLKKLKARSNRRFWIGSRHCFFLLDSSNSRTFLSTRTRVPTVVTRILARYRYLGTQVLKNLVPSGTSKYGTFNFYPKEFLKVLNLVPYSHNLFNSCSKFRILIEPVYRIWRMSSAIL